MADDSGSAAIAWRLVSRWQQDEHPSTCAGDGRADRAGDRTHDEASLGGNRGGVRAWLSIHPITAHTRR